MSEEPAVKFSEEPDFSPMIGPQTDDSDEDKKLCDKKRSYSRRPKRKKEIINDEQNNARSCKKKKIFEGICSEEAKKCRYFTTIRSSENVGDANKETNKGKSSSNFTNLKNKTPKEIIKTLFLVDMPPDFYSFYEFCEFVSKSLCSESFKLGELKLVGPFDVLTGKLNYSVDPDLYLCHWRFYYDPPEFQTVLAAESGYHIGYWRDDPKENPVFLASNNSNEDYIFKIEAETLFGAVFHYLNEFKRTVDPFMRVKTAKLQLALKDWAKKNNYPLEKKTSKINSRQKKIVAKTFHGLGIVVPVETKSELGYRPLIETDDSLKNICNLIIKAKDENERESLWENLQPLITAANIANDECDFGNSLELGIDLFCMGSSVFHETIEHLLTTAYSLLNRTDFEKIIKAHLKFRRKDIKLSLCH